MKISEKYLNLIMAKLAEADIENLSDEEIKRAFKETVMPERLFELTREAIEKGIIILTKK